MALPRPLTKLVAREEEVAMVCALLGVARLVTLTGPAGVGKTRVAIAAAAAASGRGEILFVDLAPVQEPREVAGVLALALAARDGEGLSGVQRIADAIGERRLLLVLDNCEHVAEVGPELGQLLALAANLVILATSRLPLRIGGEQEFAVGPLALPAPDAEAMEEEAVELEAIASAPAVELFVQRARAVRPDFALTPANAPSVAAICACLDGLPLAIELAAAQLRTLPPKALLARLDRPLRLLTGGPTDAPARQRTLRDAIAWSVNLLSAEVAGGFRRMACFVGGCTLEAIAAVCIEPVGDEGAALALAEALVASSLLQQQEAEAEPRFVMLETVREYAGELLAAAGEEVLVRRSHAAYYLALAERAEAGLLSLEQQQWFEQLGAERENLRAAVEWSARQGDPLVGARVGAALWRFWWVRGGVQQPLAWLQAGLAALGAGGPVGEQEHAQLQLRALTACGNLALAFGDYPLAERSHREALERACRTRSSFGIVRSHYNLGLLAELQGDAEQAEGHFLACLEQDRIEPFPYGVGLFLRGLSATALARGEHGRAYTLAWQGVEILRERRQMLPLIQGLLQLSLAARALGKDGEAERHAGEAITILGANRGQIWLAEALMILGSAIAGSDPRRAALAFAAAERLLARHHAPLAPKTYVQVVPSVRLVREELGAAAFAAAWRAGQRLSFEQVLGLAQGRPTPALAQPASTPALPGRVDPDALSARELEILRLLAAGLTNKAIAGQLFMSVNTVHSHVKSIFGKLDVTTRAAATRAALVRGLVEA
jgi:predicted ATPase/DNA-binding CsgD family transcriptional regulator